MNGSPSTIRTVAPKVFQNPAPPAVQTPTTEERIRLEAELIGSLAGAMVDTLQEAGWLDSSVFMNQQFAELWRRMQATGPNFETFWATVSELGIRREVDAAMRQTIGWQYGGYIAQELTRIAWLERSSLTMAQMASATVAGDHQQVAELLEKLRDSQPKAGQAVKIRDMTDAGVSFLELIGSTARNILTGIPALDQATGGMERQNQTIIAAPPSTGKSALAFQIARNVAKVGQSVLFFSLEMSEANLFARAACGRAGIPYLDVRRGNLQPAQLTRLNNVTSEVMFETGHNLMIHDQSGTDLAQIWRIVAQTRPDVFVVDHIRFVADQYGENENKRLGFISQRLREIGKEFDCHCLALSQLSRSQKERADKRPLLTDLRDSGELEENADNVWMLYVAADGTSGITNRNLVDAELWIRKARDGVRDAKVELKFDRRLQFFGGITGAQA